MVTIVEVNLYDNEVYGTGEPGCMVAAYDGEYSTTGGDAVLTAFVPEWYPKGADWDDDTWLYPIELPRRIRRALEQQGATWPNTHGEINQ